MSAQRAEEPLPAGRLSPTHYRAVHAHLFQDVFDWAGQYRTTRISKGGNAFCFPENIQAAMTELFDLLRRERYLRS
ncbi:Fic family protein [Hyphobacterium sp. SN044]|uniref:Fic family protein n=1 Tax=Hyphobacterium sp. SN044 TaxID=2912575 RepID=UPI0034DF5D36